VPGQRAGRQADTLTAMLGPDGSVRVSLAYAIPQGRAGLWCFQASVPAGPETLGGRSNLSCLRLRPAITVSWAGDIVLGSEYGSPPANGMRVFRRVWHLLRKPDLMIGNYEGVLSSGGGTRRCSGGGLCYIFRAPPARARTLRHAGFDVMSVANNHALDYGRSGRTDTVRALRRAGLTPAGLPGSVVVRQVQDTRVAIVGMSPYPGTTSMRNLGDVRRLVRAARKRADVVVMTMHAGLEGAAGAHVPRGADYGTATRAATHAAIDTGADVVFGSGPHVVRGVERYRGRFIVYSSGNFAGWKNFARGGLSSQSGVVDVTLDYRGNSPRGRWHGVRLTGPGIPVPDSGTVVRRVRSLSRADFGRTSVRWGRVGNFR